MASELSGRKESLTDSSGDAVCFTAGGKGIPFGAGVIHAHLAADRATPAVVAGISGGALNAAAMQRCYQELASCSSGVGQEAARWGWFRRYLDLLCTDPMNLVWDGLPDQSDFFADMPPVRDPTPSLFQDPAARKQFEELELAARRELYLFVKFGNWLASLPLTVGRLTDAIVSWVRATESYPGLRLIRMLRFLWSAAIGAVLLFFYLALNPKWFPEYKFTRKGWKRFGYQRPLFGWLLWLVALALSLAFTGFTIIAIRRAFPMFGDVFPRLHLLGIWMWSVLDNPHQFAADSRELAARFIQLLHNMRYLVSGWMYQHGRVTLWIVGIIAATYGLKRLARNVVSHSPEATYFTSSLKRRAHGLRRIVRFSGKGKQLPSLLRKPVQWMFTNLELQKHLVHDFHLRVRLTRLFGENGTAPRLTNAPMPAVLVAAPLQTIPGHSGQLWARPGTSLVDALEASFAVPGLFSPLQVSGIDSENWADPATQSDTNATQEMGRALDLVDGSVIRKNPIPALFNYLLRHPEMAESLTSTEGRARLHVVHSHPTACSAGTRIAPADIADVGLKAIQLQERRDTELEVGQTNFTSRIEQEIRQRTSSKSPDVHSIFADEISPISDIKFENELSPSRDEVLQMVAQGCRRTLELLYRDELIQIAGAAPEVECCTLLKRATSRVGVSRQDGCASGLGEVCAACTKRLLVTAPHPRRTAPQDTKLAAAFPFLRGDEPRIIFLASGGVFRGPFHGGMLACLLAAQIRPQMIVGASVGTLMGGALGALLTVPDYDMSLMLLGEVIDTFLHVDERIAFTKQFKNAVRELGIRGRRIDLSPARVRQLVNRGTRSDAGFAATGAPAALIDAISDLTMIPHKETGEIASQFLAGHVSNAAKLLIDQLKGETLFRLGIRDAVIGTSLLGPTARRLLGEQTGFIDLRSQQPFRNIGFFATTTALLEEQCEILGHRRFDPNASYDFVQAALASSAFPAIFAPLRESDVFTGTGSAEMLFSDGGMFDNLPYIPAITVLGEIQREYSLASGLDPIAFLKQRHSRPDLFIVGSLDIESEKDASGAGPFDNLIAIRKRAKLLANNVKIRAFEDLSIRIHKQLDRLLDPKNLYSVPSDREFIDSIVDAATLAVFPSDADHLNPTFAFCRSTGFKSWRVQKSIADGCFQTFAKFIECMGPVQSISLARAIEGLLRSKRLPQMDWSPSWMELKRGECPYFRHSTMLRESHAQAKLVLREKPANFTCPFYDAWQHMSATPGDGAAESAASSLAIFHECVFDPSHKRAKREADALRVNITSQSAAVPASTQPETVAK